MCEGKTKTYKYFGIYYFVIDNIYQHFVFNKV